MSGRQSLGLAFLTAGVFLLYVTVRGVVKDDGLPLVPLILGLVLLTLGWEWLDIEDRIVGAWRDRKRMDLRLIAAGVGVVVIIGAVVLVVSQQESEPYPAGARGDFMADCTLGQADWRPLCDCQYDYLEANVDFDRYEEIAGLSVEDASESDELQRAARECILEEKVELPNKLQN